MLDALKTLPVSYVGQLHDVELVQFSLDPEEVAPHLPARLALRTFGGRAMVSLVNVRLRGMRPSFAPPLLTFSYRHVAFRLLVDDRELDPARAAHGIFFLRSFTDRPLLARAGNLLTHYRLHPAEVRAGEACLTVREKGRYLSYGKGQSGNPGIFGSWDEARTVLQSLDRAYAVDPRERIWRTRILRPDWPLEPLPVASFATDFFATARLECAFRVPEVIPYRWLAPVRVPGLVTSGPLLT